MAEVNCGQVGPFGWIELTTRSVRVDFSTSFLQALRHELLAITLPPKEVHESTLGLPHAVVAKVDRQT